MPYRCISCGFWTGPRAAHWINDEGLCRICASETTLVLPPSAPSFSNRPPVEPASNAPVVPIRPALHLQPSATRPSHSEVVAAPPRLGVIAAPPRLGVIAAPPRLGVIAALVLTVVMFCLTTLPAQPRAAATGAAAAATPRSTPGNPNAGCHQQGETVGGPYDATCGGGASNNGNGTVQPPGRPCAGCVGNADNQQPPGQMPGGSDSNNGFECDGNQGVGQGNPAHTSCTPPVTVTPTITPTPRVTPTPTITPTPRVTPTPTITPTPRVTPSVTPTATPRVTPSVTPTITPGTPSGSQPTPGATVLPGEGSGPGAGGPPGVIAPGPGTQPPGPAPIRDQEEAKPDRPGSAVLGIRLSAAPGDVRPGVIEAEAAPAAAEVLPVTGLSVARWLFAAFALIVSGSVLARRGSAAA